MSKEIIKYIGKAEYDPEGQLIWIKDHDIIAKIRGCSTIRPMFKDLNESYKFQDSVGQFITDAINEKIEREKLK